MKLMRFMKSFFSFFFQYFVFFLCSTIDISIAQSNPSTIQNQIRQTNKGSEKKTILEFPRKCLSSQKSCTFKLEKGTPFVWTLEDSHSKIVVSEKGMASHQKEKKNIYLINGTFLIETEKQIRIQTSYGSLRISNGKILLKVEKEKVTAFNISSHLYIHHTLSEKQLLLPKGYQIWFSGFLTSENKKTPLFGVPQLANYKTLLSHWVRLNNDPPKEFQKNFNQFKATWKTALEDVSHWHKTIIKRKLASFNKKVEPITKERRVKKKSLNRKDCAIQKIFLKKNYLDGNRSFSRKIQCET